MRLLRSPTTRGTRLSGSCAPFVRRPPSERTWKSNPAEEKSTSADDKAHAVREPDPRRRFLLEVCRPRPTRPGDRVGLTPPPRLLPARRRIHEARIEAAHARGPQAAPSPRVRRALRCNAASRPAGLHVFGYLQPGLAGEV